MPQNRRIAVIVLGEIGRSPRMRNHARELVAAGFQVVLVGYAGCTFEPPTGVRISSLHPISRPAPTSRGLGFALVSAVRFALLFLELLLILLKNRPAALVVQNPPALPVLTAARLLSIRVVLDWHNYGWTMLGMRLGPGHWLLRAAERWEIRAGRSAFAHLAVSTAMCADLALRKISARLLYDCPLETVSKSTPANQGRLVAVCPAGWTAEENMDLLLDALPLLPADGIEFHLTGDGPLRSVLESRIDGLRQMGYRIKTGFLGEADYRALLQRADIGLSLHRSSSGLDLAMKVVDLLGAGVPVCALDYGDAVREQIRDGETGYLFRTPEQLAGILVRGAGIRKLRSAPAETWSEAWRRQALPVVEAAAR